MIPPRLREIFDQAVQCSAGERPQLVERECGDDQRLRMAVMELLAAHDRAGAFLSDPTIPPEAFELPDQFPAGSRISRYTVVRRIGQGGCGTVYLAEEDLPLKRRVALKVIRPGLDSAHIIARFELERQLLVRMDHPNIARILDAGSTEQGLPFFVMEFVDGSPLTEFCRAFELDLEQRLSLVVMICDAVQHAHARGVFHRDLKPQNVLVAIRDGNPVPKIIDFGISHALGACGDAGMAPLSGSPYFVGTPQYMSPEQAAGQGADARTDVYSLGALLHELLVGGTPFGSFQPIAAERPGISSQVSHGMPAHLSRSPVAQARLRELDRIVTKAMNKDPDQRYSSAEALGADLTQCRDALRAAKPRSGRLMRFGAWQPKRLRWVAGLAAALAILSVTLFYFAHRNQAMMSSAGSAPSQSSSSSSTSFSWTTPAPTAQQIADAPLVPGLVAERFQGIRFQSPVSRRVDADVNFSWPVGVAPGFGITPPKYSIRWTGVIVIPPAGIRAVAVRADDGARLFIDGRKLLEFDRPATRICHLSIEAGRHTIQLEYWNRFAQGNVTLYWLNGDDIESAQPVPPTALFHVRDIGGVDHPP